MANGMDAAKRTINGTYGELWLDNELVGECYGMNAKLSTTKEDINMPGQLAVDSKIKSTKGTGSLKLYKTTSRMATAVADALRNGTDVRFTLVSKLADPDSFGAERVAVKNVSFDDLILANWETNTIQKDDVPFTFTDFAFLDKIEVQ